MNEWQIMNFIQAFIHLFVISAPWLLLGFTIASLLKAFIPPNWLAQHLGNDKWTSVIKAAFIGAPLPLCSCGVVPAATGLRRAGASKPATISFLVATPETGVDSVSITYALMGPIMAVIRPVAAISSAIVAGLLVGRSENEGDIDTPAQCCKNESCNSEKGEQQVTPTTSVISRLVAALKFSFIDLLHDIAKWLVVGLAVAALIQVYIPSAWIVEWGQGVIGLVAMALVGIPMYICATASTPIAASLLVNGVSPGAVLVFMLVGPATNIGTLGIINRQFGRRALVSYLSGVVITAFSFAIAVNCLFADLFSHQAMTRLQPELVHYSAIHIFAAALLVVLLLVAMAAKYGVNSSTQVAVD